jgi:hypothetical protein
MVAFDSERLFADLREAGYEIRRADAAPIKRNPGG